MIPGVPGSNLLSQALRVINPQNVYYYKYLSHVINNLGISIPTYNARILVQGSLQNVPRNLYQLYGLDTQKDYFTFYTTTELLDIDRITTPDLLVVQITSSLFYQYVAESSNDWNLVDGWNGVLFVLENKLSSLPS